MGKLSNSVVRGTPINHVGPAGAFIGGREGYSPGKPDGMAGTVKEQFSADQRGYQTDPRSGTPYNSDLGNPDESRRVADGSGRYGVVLSENGHDHNNPASSGSGVILDGADSYGRGFQPPARETMDSPVPRHAPVFDPGFIPTEDKAHLGSGNEGAASDGLVKGGGVMSR